MIPKLVEIDLTQTTKFGGAGLEVGPTYLVLINGRFSAGTFGQQWYGLVFFGSDHSKQYDPPGTNSSRWQRAWRIENAATIAGSLEMEMANSLRQQAIGRLTCNDQTIDDTTPIEAYLYRATKPAMPSLEPDDEN